MLTTAELKDNHYVVTVVIATHTFTYFCMRSIRLQ